MIDNGDTDVFAVFNFETDIFFDNWVVGVADDEKSGALRF